MTVECKDCVLEVFCGPVKVGLAELEAHLVPLPVTHYLLRQDVQQLVGVKNLYSATFNAACRLIERLDIQHVEFYPALYGFPLATLGAIDGFRACGVQVDVMEFDVATGEYFVVPIRQEYNL